MSHAAGCNCQKHSMDSNTSDTHSRGKWPRWLRRLVGRIGLVRHSEVRAMLADPVALRANVLRHGPKGYDLFFVADILDDLETAARQICSTQRAKHDYNGQVAGTLVTDSGAISTAADLLRRLAEAGRFRIVAEGGRMVVGYWPENDPLCSPNDQDKPRRVRTTET